MGFSIRERMAGYVALKAPFVSNEHRPFEFNINAFCNRWGYPFVFQFKGHAHLPGFPVPSHFPESVTRPPVEGSMEISHQGVSYDFHMELPQMGRVRVRGAKCYYYGFNLKRVLAGLVTLPLEITHDDEKIGEGLLLFRDPLWTFPFCTRITGAPYAYHPRRKFAQALLPFASVLVPDVEKICPDSRLIVELVEAQVEKSSWVFYKALHLGALTARFFSWIYFGKPLPKLDQKQREVFARSLARNPFLRIISLPFITMLLGAIFGGRDWLKKKGQNIPVPPEKTEDERWMELNVTPTQENSRREIEVDVVVVGTGAGGAAAAYQLVRRGFAVAMVEEGHYFKRQDMGGSRIQMMSRLYRKNAQSFVLSNCPIWLPTGKCVGGTTAINSGTCLRTPAEVFERWGQEGLSELGPTVSAYFSQVEEMLDAKLVPKDLRGGISDVLTKGLSESSLRVEPLMRAETGCDGQSFCTQGCPTGAKRSTDVSYVPEAMKSNAYLFSHYRVQKVLFDGNKAIGVKAHLQGYGEDFSLTIKARKVLVAAGALESPRLLRDSGVRLPKLGKELTIHPALTIGGLFDVPVRESLFVPQSLGIFGLPSKDFVLEGYTLPVDCVPLAFSAWGGDLQEIMDNVTHFTNFSSMIRDPIKGQVAFTPWGPLPVYFLDKKMRTLLRDSALLLANVFFDAGAKSVYLPISGYDKISSRQELEKLKETLPAAHQYLLSAHHPLGTCRMGTSSQNSVTDMRGAVWGFENLHVVDGSTVPGPLGVNPQVTIMANSLRIADLVAKELG